MSASDRSLRISSAGPWAPLLMALWLAGCVPTSSGRGGGCVEGEAEACTCLDGTRALRTCEGDRFGDCPCDGPEQDGGADDARIADRGAGDAMVGDATSDACAPACGERVCGSDGCGGVCGVCEDGEYCAPDGACAAEPVSCGDGECSDDESCVSCAADCGCAADEVCDPVAGTCGPAPCEPACAGRACGPDGCGGVCGDCDPGERCTAEGVCAEDDPCPERPCDILWAARCTDDETGRVLCVPDGGCPTESRRIACDPGRRCADGACGGATTDVEVLFVLDRSSSMADGRWQTLGDAIEGFVERYGAWHRVGVRAFPGDGCDAGPVPALGLDAGPAVRAVLAAGTAAGDQTPMAAALSDLAPAFGDFDEAQVVVLLTDGTETCADDDAALLTAVDDLRRRGVDLYAIGVGPRADRELLARIAARAGREAALPAVEDGADLTAWLEGLLVRYDATRCDHDGIACDGAGLVECRDRRVVEARSCPDLCIDGEGCVTCWPPATTRCVDEGRRAVCGDDGAWGAPEACPFCLGDDCVDCAPGAAECVDETRRRVCGPDGRWRAPQACDHCLGDACVECRPGATRCAADDRQETCGPDGAWGAAEPCAHCLGDACVACRPGAAECVDDVRLRTCDAQGRWQTEQCAACVDATCRVCRPGDVRCADGASDQTCGPDGVWGPPRACESCVGGLCRFEVVVDDVRLVDGFRPSEGRVEVRHNGEWGHICGRNFDAREERVICRQLGLPTQTTQLRYSAPFGAPPPDQVAWLDGVQCAGDEARLLDCELPPWLIDGECQIYAPVSLVCLAGECHPGDTRCVDDTHIQRCGDDELWQEAEACAACVRTDEFLARDLWRGVCRPCSAGQTRCVDGDRVQTCGDDDDWDPASIVDCADGCVDGGCRGDGEVRLVDGPTPWAGRVEVQHNGEWGQICGRNFDAREGRTICRELGLPTDNPQERHSQPFGPPPADQVAWLDGVECGGAEESLLDCALPPWLIDGECWIYAPVSLACLTGECYPGDERCVDDTHIQVCGDDQQWQVPEQCAACVRTDEYLADNLWGGACRPCSAGQTRCVDGDRVQTCGEDDDWDPNGIIDCPEGCADDACVGDGEVRLVDGPTPWAGRVEVRHNGEWGQICGRDFDAREGRVICRELGLPTDNPQERHSQPFGPPPAAQVAWLDGMNCGGAEASLLDCDLTPWLVDGECWIYAAVSLACLAGECYPGDERCVDDTHIQLCGDDQQWQVPEQCAACVRTDEYLADNLWGGVCRPCSAGQTRCVDADRVQICGEDDDWDPNGIIDCPDGCAGDACVGG